MQLEGKVAIVAGAAWGGIGAATAYRFACEGAKVVVNTRQRAEKLEETVSRIRDAGGEAASVMGDVADENTWKTLVQTALDRFGKVTTLVHNAAHSYTKPAIEFTQEEWNEGLAVTLGGPWLGAKHCIPEMTRVGGGAIVYISTVNATITNPGFGLYGAAKGGLNALTRSIALDYGRQGIRANAIAPGQIVGEREAATLADDPVEEQACRDCYPIGRYGKPEEIANVALFLASDEASFVTGIVLTADGGLTLQSPEALVRPSFRRRWRDDILVPQRD
ncbi:MAG: glucose 1-dehydrogenase [Candidatus Poribacteria bacterium]|nr:glucose 1-dehydrogenase [Candidatus Poribacteria bacterium]